MTLPKIALLLYGVLLLAMGVQSYFFPTGEPSLVSLFAAGGTGLVVIICFFLSLKHPRWAYIITLIIAVLTLGRFTPVYLDEGQVYPALTAVIASALVIIVLISGHVTAMKKKKQEDTPPAA